MTDIQAIANSKGIYQKNINGKDYSLRRLPARVGLKTFFQLIELFGPSVASIADNSLKEDYILPEEQFLFTQAIQLLVERMGDKEEILDMLVTLTDNVSCGGEPIDFDTHFAGNYGELMIVLEWVLSENFKDAFMSWLKEKGLQIPTLDSLLNMATSSVQLSKTSTETPSSD